MVRALALITIIIAMQLMVPTIYAEEGLTIVVTFPSLKSDIEQIVCPGDKILSIVPPGIDPHIYQLTPRDIELLSEADIIVSTAHTGFELKIRELVEESNLKAKLIEIPKIDGITLLKNPVTGRENYHMPIYDPKNYITFLKHLAIEMASLRPSCREVYLSKVKEIEEKIDKLIEEAPKLRARAIGDSPLVQYAVRWLGIEVVYLLEEEHGAPIPPHAIAKVEKLLKEGVDLVVVCEGSGKHSTRLMELAQEFDVSILRIPSPLNTSSTLEKLTTILERAKQIFQEPQLRANENAEGMPWLYLVIAVLILAIVIFVSKVMARVRS